VLSSTVTRVATIGLRAWPVERITPLRMADSTVGTSDSVIRRR
jgi:hypothetical protein